MNLADQVTEPCEPSTCKVQPNHCQIRIFSLPFYKMILKADSPPPAGMPRSLEKIGDHIRKARIERSLEQGHVAEILGVTGCTIWNWENNRSSPPVHQCRRVIEFLGYDPFPIPGTFSEELVSFRRLKGLRVKDAAALANVDPATWSSWERKEHEITDAYRGRVLTILAQ